MISLVFSGLLTNDQIGFPVAEVLPGIYFFGPFLNAAPENSLVLFVLVSLRITTRFLR